MTDIFEEVEEQLRSDRYQQLIFRSWPWIAGVAAAVLLGALGWWAYDTWSTREAAKASEVYSAALESLGQGDTKAAFAKFSEAEKSPSRGYKALSLMQQGAIRLQEGKREDAVKLFDQAASASPNPIMGDMARLKSAFALMDTAPYAVMQERLTPLIDLKRPYHVAAREALAMAKLKDGRLKEARADFVVLSLLPDAPDAVHQHAQLGREAIDNGAAANLQAAVKAAAAAPPLPPVTALATDPSQTGAGE